MKYNKDIPKTLGFGILLLIILSITPKIYLHDIFADHTDVSFCNHSDESGPCIQQQGFNCQLYELIVPHEYVLVGQLSADSDIQYYRTLTTFFSSFFIHNLIPGSAERAPPALV